MTVYLSPKVRGTASEAYECSDKVNDDDIRLLEISDHG